MQECKHIVNHVLSAQSSLLSRHLEATGYDVKSDSELLNILDVSNYDRLLQSSGSAYKLSTECRNKLGMIALFAPLVKELQALCSDGFSVDFENGQAVKFYAVLCSVSGDNLSSHALAGFRQVFNSGRVCRMCMVSHADLGKKLNEQGVVLRNSLNHAYHLKAVADNSDNAAIYGVTGPSVFSVLPYFDVTSGFPPDILHDCSEGIIPKVVEAIIKRLMTNKLVTVSKLNENMAAFTFKGHDRLNKPEPLKQDGSFIGSASQKMCLFRLLPFFVDLSRCATALKLYCLAREVMMYVFGRYISRADLNYLEQRIETLLAFITEHFACVRITPKFHFLIHYPSMMAKFGPLRELWCMRYEAKHQYFKSVAKSTGNFINIASTLATRHQMLQCYLFSGKQAFQQEVVLPSSGKNVPFTSLCIDVQQLLCYASSFIWSVKEATVNACTYSIGAAIVIDFTSDGDPVFIKIANLLLPHDSHLDIIGKLLLPVAFSRQYFAYEVAENGWVHCHPGAEKDCALLWPVTLSNGTYISMPYCIPPWSGCSM